MAQRVATVLLERGGETSALGSDLSPETVARVVRDSSGAQDVTVSVSPEGSDERLMIAVHGSWAFLGLERRGAVFQFVPSDRKAKDATCFFVIGRQDTHIEGRYVVDVETAANVAAEWMTGTSSSRGVWERQ